MTLQSNLRLSLLTLLIMVWITDGSSSSTSHSHIQKSFHHSKKGPMVQESPQLLMDKPRSNIPTGKCHTPVQKSTYPSIERTDASADNDISPESVVICVGVSNLTFTVNSISPKMVSFSSVKSIQVFNSSIPILNLGVFRRFPRLQEISVIHSSVSLIRGSIPPGIIRFNLSSNHIRHIDSSVFSHSSSRRSGSRKASSPILMKENSHTQSIAEDSSQSETNDSVAASVISASSIRSSHSVAAALNETKSNKNAIVKDFYTNETQTDTNKDDHDDEEDAYKSNLREIDLSHNKIIEIPPSIFRLKQLKSLRIAGNQFKCEFVWEKLWDWYETQPDPVNILPDADDAFCGVVDDVHLFHYTVLGVLKAKKDLEETCGSVDKNLCPECSLYALQREGDPVSHKSSHGSISISLKIGCASRNLTQLPPIPQQTWQLNISHNFIRDLSPLKEPMYQNLLILDGDNNRINLETIMDTPFVEKYNYLSLQNNHFTSIPPEIFSSFKTMRGQGITFFGGNFIDCNCEVAKQLRPLLIENSQRIKDMRDIYCNEGSKGDGYVRVKDLQIAEVCPIDIEDDTNEMYLYLIITVEVLLIIVIIAKVWYDQRNFRRTGMLPWLSSCMPRLPCDAILESVKEPPNYNNRPSVSVHSSSTNVQSHSAASHLQTRGGGAGASGGSRSNLSPHSDKSRQSHFSSLPSTSSRTSPV